MVNERTTPLTSTKAYRVSRDPEDLTKVGTGNCRESWDVFMFTLLDVVIDEQLLYTRSGSVIAIKVLCDHLSCSC